MDQQIALLITPIASARALAALGKLADVPGLAFATEHGAVMVFDDADFAAAHKNAQQLSQILKQVDAILLRRGPSEDPADSDVQATRFSGGEMGDKLAPGLIINGLDPLCERLILGGLPVDELIGEVDAIHSTSLSKFAAMRALAAGRKKN